MTVKKFRIYTFVIALVLPCASVAEQCPDKLGQAAQEWSLLFNNAIRTADDYAIARNPIATFALGDADLIYQFGGEFAGSYLVRILATTGQNTSFAMLNPMFDPCEPVAGLDDSRSDLFQVVVAKFNGREF